jgi:hypothetical protein
MVTANQIADAAGLNRKSYRAALRKAIHWHIHQARWEVIEGSSEHKDMLVVRDEMIARQNADRI